MSDLRRKLIRLAHANPDLREDILPLLKEARGAGTIPVGTGGETDHVRYHRYMHSVRVTDLTNAGRRGKMVDILAVTDLDYLGKNDIAQVWLDQWFKLIVGGADFQKIERGLDQLLSKLDRSGHYPLPKKHTSTEKGVRVDPPSSRMNQLKDVKLYEDIERTVFIREARPSDVSINEIIFFVDEETGKRGPYMSHDVLSNTRKVRETKALYRWVVKNERRLKSVRSLREIKRMADADGIPYRIFHLD